MRICSVSDVHIKREGDEAAQLFAKFLKSAENFDHVVLLGDIFDLVVGGGADWLKKFPQTFKLLEDLSHKTQIHFIEGNHDFHLRRLFETKPLSKIKHYDGDFLLENGPLRLRFSHGDDVEVENPSYRRYKKIIKNRFIEMLASEFVPVKLISAIGERASAASAKRSRRYEVGPKQQARIKDKFRRSADHYYKKMGPFDLLLCGHSHVKDSWDSALGFHYANNGYFLQEKTFAAIIDGKVDFVKLV